VLPKGRGGGGEDGERRGVGRGKEGKGACVVEACHSGGALPGRGGREGEEEEEEELERRETGPGSENGGGRRGGALLDLGAAEKREALGCLKSIRGALDDRAKVAVMVGEGGLLFVLVLRLVLVRLGENGTRQGALSERGREKGDLVEQPFLRRRRRSMASDWDCSRRPTSSCTIFSMC